MTLAINMTIDTMISHAGIPMAIRAGITMGEKSGNMDDQKAREPLGARIAANMIYNAKMTGIVIGSVNV